MKKGIRLGQVATIQVTVTPEMQAQFEDIVVHELYATAAMLNNMEWAARQHILPVLEPGEDGVGYHMDLRHLAPVAIGETVEVKAMVTGLMPGRVICQCTAWHQGRKIGEATVVQAILPVAKLRARITREAR